MPNSIIPRSTGIIARFFDERQYGFIQTDSDVVFFHINAVRPDSVGRRIPYAKAGLAVTFIPADDRGQSRARDVTPVDPILFVDPRCHRELSRVVYISDAGDSGFLERAGGDTIYFRTAPTLSTLAIGSIVEHGVFKDGRKFKATKLKIISAAPELRWPLDDVRPLHS